MSKSKILPIINTMLIILLIIYSVFVSLKKKPDIVFIDQKQLFNEFIMTKEIKVSEELKMELIRKKLDSVFTIYERIEDKSTKESKFLQTQIQMNSSLLQDIQNNFLNTTSPKIFNRLNTYIQEYAYSKEIEFVLSSDKSRNVVYTKSNLDYTDRVLEYINARYEGAESISLNLKNKD